MEFGVTPRLWAALCCHAWCAEYQKLFWELKFAFHQDVSLHDLWAIHEPPRLRRTFVLQARLCHCSGLAFFHYSSPSNTSDDTRVLQYFMLHYLPEALSEMRRIFRFNIAYQQSRRQLLFWRPYDIRKQKQRGKVIFCVDQCILWVSKPLLQPLSY